MEISKKIKIKKKWYKNGDKVIHLTPDASPAWSLDFKGLRNANS